MLGRSSTVVDVVAQISERERQLVQAPGERLGHPSAHDFAAEHRVIPFLHCVNQRTLKITRRPLEYGRACAPGPTLTPTTTSGGGSNDTWVTLLTVAAAIRPSAVWPVSTYKPYGIIRWSFSHWCVTTCGV